MTYCSFTQVFFTPADFVYLKRNYNTMVDAAEGPIHPKLAKRLKKCFDEINKVGDTIYRHRKGKKPKRTWKDSDEITLYLP
jgi:hypothetical protein